MSLSIDNPGLPAQRPDDRLDVLLGKWEERREVGQPVSIEELCDGDPQLAEELSWTVRALEAVEQQFGLHSRGADVGVGEPGRESADGDRLRSANELRPPTELRVFSEYRIGQLHASGGLGSVYLATEPALNRRVAVKFPRSRHLSHEQAERFEREARITGRLNHPGIIPVHALRAYGSGQPCYVMRFVDGGTLQSAIELLHSPTPGGTPASLFESYEFRQLLQKFVAVCNIAAYAHGERVIHRDIKPANILLGTFGEVLLLDWGLAKSLDTAPDACPDTETRDEDSQPFQTGDGRIPGTPAFASPEQLLGRTADVDERTDVYSLGATLFSLLTGRVSMTESSLPDYLQRLGRNQQTSVHDCNPAVPAVLEAVCRRAMSIDPAGRYQSALELAGDIDRFLAGESVSVYRDSVSVRVSRLVRRRPGFASAVAATVVVTLLAASAGSLALGRVNRRLHAGNHQLQIAVEDSQTANRHALEALRILFDDVVTGKLSSQESLTAADREFLSRILEQYESFAAAKGDSIKSRSIRAEGLYQSGQILKRLSEEVDSRERFETAAEILQELWDETAEPELRYRLATTLDALSDAQRLFGELDAAERTAVRGIALLDDVADSQSVDAAEIQTLANFWKTAGFIQSSASRWDDAVASLSNAKRLLERLRDQSKPAAPRAVLESLAGTYRTLSEAYGETGDQRSQEQLASEAVRILRQLVSEDPRQARFRSALSWALYDYSIALETMDRIPHALAAAEEAADVARQLADEFPLVTGYRGALASAVTRRGTLHGSLGHFDSAVSDLREAVTIANRVLEQSSDGALTIRLISETYHRLGQLQAAHGVDDQAEASLRESVRTAEQLFEAFPEFAAASADFFAPHIELAELLDRTQRFTEATDLMTSSLEVNETMSAHVSGLIRRQAATNLREKLTESHSLSR